MSIDVKIALAVGGIIALGAFALLSRDFILWILASSAGARISFGDILGMRFRKVDVRTIVISHIRAMKAGLNVSTRDLELHYLAGGRVPNCVTAVISAKKANVALDWDIAAAIDLAGRDVLDAVNASVNPKVLTCPDPQDARASFVASAQDGVPIRVSARVSVRVLPSRLVGGRRRVPAARFAGDRRTRPCRWAGLVGLQPGAALGAVTRPGSEHP